MDLTIEYTKRDALAILTLQKPPANGYDIDMLTLLATYITEIEADLQVKVVQVRSSNARFFSAGADIKVFGSNTTEQNTAMVVAARRASDLIQHSSKIYVAAIQGHALGGGLELAMACDIRLAAEGTYAIGLPEVKLGLMPGNGGAVRLIDLIGKSRALELLLTGDSISPQQAYAYGLFTKLYPEATFGQEVEQYLATLALGAGQAMAAIKRFSRLSMGLDQQQGLALEKECVDRLYDTEDAVEGFKAFIEKRNPNYK
ncbi:enoyl-CoA hydratase/carnithine racemase [Dyadobacter jejuensis]|uniref:Enoyl-CoA hydratase/carnithine racemase n=1 Tax=Dyadobacter jejuensis TaxID=1082580 RepID=A0A316ALS9_9BACT|nr:enoyl-CoA hydratase-related protein [Dyadobacter jejuensis]PWJ58014.1 enoyl-CoA hydratase/carnithine racemase [Dyadobacter jejuensis]